MALAAVEVTPEVWLTCLTHALSTETEEIMGLLLGDVKYDDDGKAIANIWSAAPQMRSDRRKDRVETNPEQLAAASAEAERLSQTTGRTTRVIGWYHSHPKITVFPSHVDVRTQGQYQMLDQGFVGLIFSCFSEDASKVGRMHAIAFQSVPVSAEARRLGTPSPATTGTSRAAEDDDFMVLDTPPRAVPPKVNPENTEAAAMEEAMLRSNLDHSAADYTAKEVPMRIVPSFETPSDLSPLIALQKILFREEQAAYRAALRVSSDNGKLHPLAAVHHGATYQASLCKLMEHCLSPVITALHDRKHQALLQLACLKEEAQRLQTGGRRLSDGASPFGNKSQAVPSPRTRAAHDAAAGVLGLRVPPPLSPSTSIPGSRRVSQSEQVGVEQPRTRLSPSSVPVPFSDLLDLSRVVPVAERQASRGSSRGPPMVGKPR